jgi:hypothetical protein
MDVADYDHLLADMFARFSKADWVSDYFYGEREGWTVRWTAKGQTARQALLPIITTLGLDQYECRPGNFHTLANSGRVPRAGSLQTTAELLGAMIHAGYLSTLTKLQSSPEVVWTEIGLMARVEWQFRSQELGLEKEIDLDVLLSLVQALKHA